MADVLGINATLFDDDGKTKIDDGLIQTNEVVWTDEFEASSTVAGTIRIAHLPNDAKVQSVEVFHDALTGNFEVGDTDDTDRYIASAAVTAAGSLALDSIDGLGYVIGSNAGDNNIIITNDATITGTIKTKVKYTLS